MFRCCSDWMIIVVSVMLLSSFSKTSSRMNGRNNNNSVVVGAFRIPNRPKKIRSTCHNKHVFPFLLRFQQQQQQQRASFATTSLRMIGSSNEELVRERLRVAREKKQARQKSTSEIIERNYRLKRLLHSNNNNTVSSSSSLAGGAQNSSATASGYVVPPMYAVKLSVCDELRRELRLSGRERRGRIFVEQSNRGATTTIKGLKSEIHAFFRALKKSTFLVSASLPEAEEIGANGGLVADAANNATANNKHWNIESDDDVVKTFRAADDFFCEVNNNDDDNDRQLLKRPSIRMHIRKDPNGPKPPPLPSYLRQMANPGDSPTITMLSFYSFPPNGGIPDPEGFAAKLRKTFKNHFHALGRIYVAREGVNAQMSVPTNVLDNFIECCQSMPELGEYMENGINIDPIPLSREEYFSDDSGNKPFRNLHVRVRNQIVADGFDESYDWQSAGYDMPPLEWHETLKGMAENNDTTNTNNSSTPLVFDCRNSYETDIGRFVGAVPLETENFRDSWGVLRERLADKPKDTPIMTYCTGGIRCVKVNAYLTQELGFTNVSRLAGGIIAYDRTINEHNERILDNNSTTTENTNTAEETTIANQTESQQTTTTTTEENNNDERLLTPLFKGTNFVFDGRLGRKITTDSLAKCITCDEKTSLVSNCLNDRCHIRMNQCEKCRKLYHGTCGNACKERWMKTQSQKSTQFSEDLGRIPTTTKQQPQEQPLETSETTETTKNNNNNKEKQHASVSSCNTVEEYAEGYSTPVPSFYGEIERNTRAFFPSGSHMVSGTAQGRLLKQFASMTREGRILELGTFTGYATACFLEGSAIVAASAFSSIGNDEDNNNENKNTGGPLVVSLERDPRAFDLAVAHLKAMSKHGVGREGAEEARRIRQPVEQRDDEQQGQQQSPLQPPEVIDETTVSFRYKDTTTRCELHRVTDALATLEEMAATTNTVAQPFDLVFIDADKTRLLDYAEACLNNDNVLKKGGLIIVDNVLWKGLVLDYAASSDDDNGPDDKEAVVVETTTKEERDLLRKNRRARKLASAMHRFNSRIVEDDRVEVLLLSIRDGLSLIRKL